MPRNASISVENNFSKGLITEVTGVNSPENSVSESLNVIYDRIGRALSRPAIDYEEDFDLQTIADAGTARAEFVWDVSQTGSFVVCQFGSVIRFFTLSETQSLSSGLKSFQIDLLDYKTPGTSNATVETLQAAFSAGKNYLFVAHPRCESLYVSYDPDADDITVNPITIQVRDFEGVDDGLAYGERPSTLSDLHTYNLYNQGWYAKDTIASGNGALYNYLYMTHAQQPGSEWPSNSDIPWLYRFTNAGSGETTFAWGQRSRTIVGNSATPKGHFILKAFDIDRNGLTGDGIGAYTTQNIPTTSSGGARPSSVAFFMGRVWYSAVDADGYRSSVYFSQVLERDEQIGYCYQQNDPTSEHLFDLIASDGGVIRILDIGQIVDIKAFGQAIFVFASNGVWSISGTQTTPFSAQDYSVTKVSSFGLQGKTSIVELGNAPVWWNYEGIYALTPDKAGFGSDVTNLTESTIQTFYNNIPATCKLLAKGVFNDQENVVYWLYSTDEDDPDDYDSILAFDARSTAFYPLNITTEAHRISGLISVRNVSQNFDTVSVVSGIDPVFSGVDEVTTDQSAGFTVSSKTFKFVTTVRASGEVTFSNFLNSQYRDWVSSGTAEDYTAYFITGYRIRGELIKKFQTNYLVIMSESTGETNESCFLQGLWDYRTDELTSRFTVPQQVYKYFHYTKYQRSKKKVRGNGYSLQFKFFGEEGKPFIIIGWAGFETADSIP